MLMQRERWTHTERRPLNDHREMYRIANFSGEAFDQVEPILALVREWLDELNTLTTDQDVWRIGQITLRIRTGKTGGLRDGGLYVHDGIDPDDDTTRVLIERDPQFARVGSPMNRCPHCHKLATEDGQVPSGDL